MLFHIDQGLIQSQGVGHTREDQSTEQREVLRQTNQWPCRRNGPSNLRFFESLRGDETIAHAELEVRAQSNRLTILLNEVSYQIRRQSPIEEVMLAKQADCRGNILTRIQTRHG